MKLFTALATASIALTGIVAPAAQAGFAWTHLGANTYCQARAMGMSHKSAKNVAILKAQSPTVASGSDMDYYNAGLMISNIKAKCGDQWNSGEQGTTSNAVSADEAAATALSWG